MDLNNINSHSQRNNSTNKATACQTIPIASPSNNIINNIPNSVTLKLNKDKDKTIDSKAKNEIEVYGEALLKKEEEILELHRQYLEMKRDRLKSATDFKYLSNKFNLLQVEEKKTYIKVNKLKKTQEELNSIRNKVMEGKKCASQVKLIKSNEEKEKKNKAIFIKENVSQINSNWRNIIAIKNQKEKEAMKFESKRNQSIIEINKENEFNKHKENCELLRSHRLEFSKNKLIFEENKRNKHIEELKRKIDEEFQSKNQFNKKIEEVEKKEIDLVNRIKTVKVDLRKSTGNLIQANTDGKPKKEYKVSNCYYFKKKQI